MKKLSQKDTIMTDTEIIEKILKDMNIPFDESKPGGVYIDGIPAAEWFEKHPDWFSTI